MSDTRVAYRYAKPLLERAIEENVLDSVKEDMELFKNTCEDNKEFIAVLKNPVIRGHKKEAILESLFKGKVQGLTLSLFKIISQRGREGILHEMSKEFINMYNEHKNIQKATVISTVKLSEDIKAELKDILARRLNKTIELEEKIDSDLIGGFIIKIGNSQIDNSIRTSLQRLKVKFSQKIYNS